jgi:hypothetical protein
MSLEVLNDLLDLWLASNEATPLQIEDIIILRQLVGMLPLGTLKPGYMAQYLETATQFYLLADIWLWALREGALSYEPGGEGLPDDG